MIKKNIKFLLVHINEAHSSAWPIGLPDQPEPHSCYNDRVLRAKEFIEKDKKEIIKNNPENSDPFIVRVDGWDNLFDDTFRVWPDKYYLVDHNYKVLAKSEYGEKSDALINVDCVTLLEELLK
jgi:hypothetical protein